MEKHDTQRDFLKIAAIIGVGTGVAYVGSRLIQNQIDEMRLSPRFFSSNHSIRPLAEINPLLEDQSKIQAYNLLHERVHQGYINGDIYTYLQPSEKYPRYWYWDNMLGAIAASFLDPSLAKEVLTTQASIFDNLGAHGAQIIYFNHSKLSLEQELFRRIRGGEKGIDQLTQTPLAGFALEIYAQKTGDMETVEKLLPSFEKHYEYIKNHRYIYKEINLPVTINPYESLDGQPNIDLMSKINCDNPVVFSGLAAYTLFKARRNHFDAKKIAEKGGFVMYDPAFCSFYIKSLFSLANLYKALGNNEKAQYWQEEADKSLLDLIATCFDEENGYFYARRANKTGELLKVDTAAGLFPLLNTLPEDITQRVVERLKISFDLENNNYCLPAVSPNEKKYNKEKVLPLWHWKVENSVIDFVTVYGLLQNGQVELAEKIFASQQHRLFERMISGHSFPEFFTKKTAFRDFYLWATLSTCSPFELFEISPN